MSLQWLDWAKKLQAIAQTGLYYKNHPFDIERYEQIQQIAAEIMVTYAGVEPTLALDMFKQEWDHATPKVDVRGVPKPATKPALSGSLGQMKFHRCR